MKKLVLSGFLAIVAIAGMNAQKAGYDPVKAPWGHGQDSIKCRENMSLLSTSANAKNYKDALKPWLEVYKNCPAASKNIYIFGPRIFKDIYAKETDAAKKKEALDKVMEIHDARLKYFGDEFSKGFVAANKAYDYIEMAADKADFKKVYEWLGVTINEMKDKTKPMDAYSYYMFASLNQFQKDPAKKEQYLKDYFAITGYVDQAISNFKKAEDKESADYLELVKQAIVKGFVDSGAGDCKTLTDFYGNKMEANKTNKEFLYEVVTSLSAVGCNESDLYFTAAEYLYKLEPSANAALGLANRSLKSNDYDTAIKYYQEASNLETDKAKSADYMMQLARIFSNQRNFSRARQAAYDALKYNPNSGDAYILIAQLYATSAGGIFPEATKRGLVFCAAVDKLQKAKSVDPSVTGEANRLIGQYSSYYMDSENAFMMGIKPGESVFIPGWIQESTTVRLK